MPSSSSSSTTSVPLNHNPSDQSYRLLELPPELLTLLESETPPTLRLQPTEAAGLLKTPDDRTWSLRQKNTSNALILLQATDQGSLDAVATVHEVVELVPEAERAGAPATAARGKWHERFGKTR